ASASIDQNVSRAGRREKMWSQIASLTAHSSLDVSAASHHLHQTMRGPTLFAVPFAPAAVCIALPWPPGRAIGMAVNRTHACNGDVLLCVGIDERRVVHQFHSLKARQDRRQVFAWILGELDDRTHGDVKVDVAFQMNGAGKE